MRSVSVFQVADNAVSRLAFDRLLNKNASLLSSRCFAYRRDITLHDAIAHIASEFQRGRRLYVAEFDFSKFFESISHDHIRHILRDRRFYVTQQESRIIDSFLEARALPKESYLSSSEASPRRGIHLGTSLSLFLANVAAYPLDRRLKQMRVDFARYADDTLIWSPDYSELCDAVERLRDAARDMGVSINLKKSPGISILHPSHDPESGDEIPAAEFRSTSRVEFLGYSISDRAIGIRESSIKRIKQHVAYLVYANLLEQPKKGVFVPARFQDGVDRDYLTLIRQLRRYLYGDLSEAKLRRYLARDVSRVRFKGLMSFFPLVDDEDLLASLDGWLLHTAYTSLRRRTSLLKGAGYQHLPTPHGIKRQDLLNVRTTSSDGTLLDLRLPRFKRISKLLRRLTDLRGPNSVAHPDSAQYYIV